MISAPAGTAADISGFIRTYVYRLRQAGGHTQNQVRRLDRIDGCASEAVARGDGDPRVRTISFTVTSGRWTPGSEQQAVLDAAGFDKGADGPYKGRHWHLAGDKLTGDVLLNELANAAVLDLQAGHERELRRAASGAEEAPTEQALVQAVTARATVAEQALAAAQQSVEHLNGRLIEEKARRRAAEALVNGDLPSYGDPNGEPKVEPEEKLPAGVRRRGDKFEGYVRVDGKQRTRVVATVAEAVEFVNNQAPELDASGGHDTFNPSPEQLAAMQEQGT